MRATILNQIGHYERARKAVEEFAGLLSMTGSAKRRQQRRVLGWLWLTAMHIVQLAVALIVRI
jgi:hypothetical protein